MQIEFVRHTETNYNVLHLQNDVPHDKVFLTEKGIKDAGKLANNLKTFPAKKIFTSEFPRCKQTAEILNKYHKVPIVVNPLVNERKTGMDGRPTKELQEMFIRKADMPNVERGSSITKRLSEFLNQIEEDCIVVTHQAVIIAVAALLQNKTYEELDSKKEIRIKLGNRATITDVELRKILTS